MNPPGNKRLTEAFWNLLLELDPQVAHQPQRTEKFIEKLAAFTDTWAEALSQNNPHKIEQAQKEILRWIGEENPNTAETRSPISGLGDAAPDFKAWSTHGEITVSQFSKAGKWVLLLFHEIDAFTPGSMAGLSQLVSEFEKRNVQLICLLLDSISSLPGWEKHIEKTLFPIIVDSNMTIASLYHLAHLGTGGWGTVQGVSLIDPTGKVRSLSASYGVRLVPQYLFRMIDAEQRADEQGIATPFNWERREKVDEVDQTARNFSRNKI